MKRFSGRLLPLPASAFMLLARVSLRGIPASEFEVRKPAEDVLVVDAGLFPSSTRLKGSTTVTDHRIILSTRRAFPLRRAASIITLLLLTTSRCLPQWTPQAGGTAQTLLGVSFTDSLRGMFVGTAGTMKRTTDGGATWIAETSGTAMFLRDVDFPSADTGFVVGQSGLILFSGDGGDHWAPRQSGTAEHLVHVHFADNLHGIATGQNGTIRGTTDGGATWDTLTSNTTVELAGVFMVDTLVAYAAGFGGTILATADGGVTWSPQASGTTADLRSVSFSGRDTGYVAGYSGTILMTTNGGAGWSPQASGTVQNLFAVTFTTPEVGTAVGTATILRTTDGGQDWNPQSVAFAGDLYDVEFAGDLRGWTVGQTGRIFFTSNGGTVTGVDEPQFPGPDTYSLRQNYPNPFNPSTTLTFRLGEAGYASLSILDVLGRVVDRPVSQFLPAGEHTREWDASGLPGGVYFCILRSGTFSGTIRLLLVR